jgi:hypothetical protein
MIKLNKFYYPTSFIRSDIEGQGRTYDVKDQVALASVTTILGETKDKSFLEDWKKRVGKEQAKKIMTDAAKRGTSMHKIIEGWVSGTQVVLIWSLSMMVRLRLLILNRRTNRNVKSGSRIIFCSWQLMLWHMITFTGLPLTKR